MKRGKKALIWTAGLGLCLIPGILLLIPSQRVAFAQTISCLKGLRPVSEKPQILHMDFSHSGGPMVHQKTYVSTYVVAKPFRQLNEELKPELKPRAYSASSFPSKVPSMTTYGFWVKGGRRAAVVTLNADGEHSTRVTVHEPAELNLLDRLEAFMGRFGGSPPKGPGANEYVVISGSSRALPGR